MKILSISENVHLMHRAARWFHEKWGIDESAYIESMQKSLHATKGVPAWYVTEDGGKIVAGLGVIENDFHKRPDLTPNICAVYVEAEYRGKGISRALMKCALSALHENGIETAYLITTHTSYYEKLGFTFYGEIEEDDGSPIRMYFRSTEDSDGPA